MRQSGRWVIHCITVNILTAIQLVSNDDKEGNTGPKGVDSDGYFTYDSCDFPTRGSNNLLIGAFVTDLKKPHRSLKSGHGFSSKGMEPSWSTITKGDLKSKSLCRFYDTYLSYLFESWLAEALRGCTS